VDVRKRAGWMATAGVLSYSKTDLLELKILPLQPFVLFDILLGWFLLDVGWLVRRGRILLGVELRGDHHDVPVSRRAHGCVSRGRSPNAHCAGRTFGSEGEAGAERDSHGGDGLMVDVQV